MQTKDIPNICLEAVIAGRVFAVGLFLTGKAVEQTGKSKTMKKAVYSVECGSEIHTVENFLPDGSDVSAWKCPFKRGQTVVVWFKTFGGKFSDSGELQGL